MASNADRFKNRHSPELKEKALALLFVKPLAEVAKELGIAKGTLSGWKKSAGFPCIATPKAPGRQFPKTPKAPEPVSEPIPEPFPEPTTERCLEQYVAPNSPELKAFVETERAEQLRTFIRSAWSVAINSINELNRRIVNMSKDLEEIERLKAYILDNQGQLLDGTATKPDAVRLLLDKLRSLSIVKTNELATIMGISYDKFALASGGVTERVGVSFEDMPE